MKMTSRNIVLAACVALAPQFVSAEEAAVVQTASTVNADGIERIEAGKFLQTYSRQVATESYLYQNGIDIGPASLRMVQARVGFDIYLSALLHGNKAHGIIGSEERQETIAQLEELQAVWTDVAQSVDLLYGSAGNVDAFQQISENSDNLLELTRILTNDLERQYADLADAI